VTQSTDSFATSRFDTLDPFESNYATPGWQRARNRRSSEATSEESPALRRTASRRRGPITIDGELVAKSTGATSAYAIGDRIFHLKFGYGDVVAIDGNKLTVAFDKAGEKRVIDSYVEPA
jgi:DNA helicase II / ATP-dependent DNA helicase PcrA